MDMTINIMKLHAHKAFKNTIGNEYIDHDVNEYKYYDASDDKNAPP